MDKNQFTNKLQEWLINFLKQKFNEEYEILDVIIPESHLSKINNNFLKSIKNYSAWDFNPDVLGIIKNKHTKEIKLIFLNRTTSAISLKEIGELYCYARLANVALAFLVSTSGVSSEVNILLIENNVRDRLLNYGNEKPIIIFSWNEQTNIIDSNSILPLEMRDYLIK